MPLFVQKFSVGLNFADEKEAVKFHQAVDAKLQEREKKASEFEVGESHSSL